MELGGSNGRVEARLPVLGERVFINEAVRRDDEHEGIVVEVLDATTIVARVNTAGIEYDIPSLCKQGTSEAAPGRNWRFPEDQFTQ